MKTQSHVPGGTETSTGRAPFFSFLAEAGNGVDARFVRVAFSTDAGSSVFFDATAAGAAGLLEGTLFVAARFARRTRRRVREIDECQRVSASPCASNRQQRGKHKQRLMMHARRSNLACALHHNH